jgi:ATP-dependent DNA helicase RecG
MRIRLLPQDRRSVPRRNEAEGSRRRSAVSTLDSPVTAVKGISAALAVKFGKLGLKTVRDLLYFFPNRHIDYSQRKPISQLREGNEETIIANVWQAQEVRPADGGARRR